MTLASIAGFKRVVRQLPRVHFPFCPTAISSAAGRRIYSYRYILAYIYIPFPSLSQVENNVSSAAATRDIENISSFRYR